MKNWQGRGVPRSGGWLRYGGVLPSSLGVLPPPPPHFIRLLISIGTHFREQPSANVVIRTDNTNTQHTRKRTFLRVEAGWWAEQQSFFLILLRWQTIADTTEIGRPQMCQSCDEWQEGLGWGGCPLDSWEDDPVRIWWKDQRMELVGKFFKKIIKVLLYKKLTLFTN